MTSILEGVTVRTATIERTAEVAVRDGVLLRATVYRGDEPRPVLLVRNPYGEPMARNVPVLPFLDAGFAVVVQDCRGCGASDGEFVPFENEANDTLDTIQWCAEQDWSTGRVVTYGASYSGMVQYAAAVHQPAALVAMIPIVAPADYHDGVAYRNGAFQLGQLSGWYSLKSAQTIQHRRSRGVQVDHLLPLLGKRGANPVAALEELPLSETTLFPEVLPSWKTWVGTEQRDAYWAGFSYGNSRSEIAVPALHVGGWFDLFLGGTLANFVELSNNAATPEARVGQRLVIGPWSHTDQTGTVGELFFGATAAAGFVGLEAMETSFALAALEGKPSSQAPVRLFVMGPNVWRDEQEWPLARTQYMPWHLGAGGTLSLELPHGDAAPTEATSQYVSDPSNPVPTVGGQTLMFGGSQGGIEWSPGPRDQRGVESHAGVLSFDSDVLVEALEVTGPVSVTLFAATTAADTDFVARLVDVWPDGRAMSVVDGIVRARSRHNGETAEPITPGEIVEYTIDLWGTSQVFGAGHRIRVDIASSSFPAFDRNPGNGGSVANTVPSDFIAATQTIFHTEQYSSRILLPVIPVAP